MTATSRRVSVESDLRTLLFALALTILGSVAGLLGAVTFQAAAGALVDPVTDAVYIVSSSGVQAGFGAFALAYLRYTGEWERYARFRWPSRTDVVAILGGFVALFVVGHLSTAVVSLVGLPTEAVVGSSDRGYGLGTPSALWALAFVTWFLLAAPAEELFYRGIVQTRLRAAFPGTAVVAIAAGYFALSHAMFAALSGAALPTMATTWIELFAGGLVLCGLYEWTDNLVPVAVFHALTWLSPIHVVQQFLAGLA